MLVAAACKPARSYDQRLQAEIVRSDGSRLKGALPDGTFINRDFALPRHI